MVNKVRAKFVCQRIEETKYSNQKSAKVILTAVTPANDQEDDWQKEKFWQYTPSGEIMLNTVNQAAVDFFEPGQKYYIDFVPVPADPKAQ